MQLMEISRTIPQSRWIVAAFLLGFLRVSATNEPVSLGDACTIQPEKEAGYLTFYLDNDLFTGNDQNYTNGGRISWISQNWKAEQLGPISSTMRAFSGDEESWSFLRRLTNFRDPDKVRYNYGVSLTQLMYTPKQPLPFDQPFGERRYAGWLGVGISLHAKDANVLNSAEWMVGVTGPESLAENVQDMVHSVRDIQKFNGWKNAQIPNSLTFDFAFTQKRRANFVTYYDGLVQMDGISEWGARLGTFRTDVHVGSLFRLGYNLPPDFSDPRVGGTSYSHRYFTGEHDYHGNWSIYAMTGSTVSVVAFDASLDGPMFTNFDTGNQRTVLVGEIFLGMGVRHGDWEVSYVQTLRTKEYREQDDKTNFGSLALRVRF